MTTKADQARVALGVRLRDIRRDAGLSATRLANLNVWLPSKVSKIEHGRQTPSEADLAAWCLHCRAPGELADLIATVRAIETQFAEWRRILRSGTRHRQQVTAAAHAKARLFRIYEPAVIPGLLQTWDYALAVLSVTVDFLQIPDDADEGTRARLDRQKILLQRDRRFHILIGEQSLNTDVGGPDVMHGQLQRVLATIDMPNVRIGIVPQTAPYRVPLHNGFWILDDGLVQFDTYTAELSLTRPDEIALYVRAFERLTALAVYGAQARGLVDSYLPQIS